MSRISLANARFAFLNQGAIIQELSVAGHNIVLSFPTADPYLNAPYFGETIGRVANRIKDGKIDHLNGRSYQLATNERHVNHIHGGVHGWGHRPFTGPRSVVRHGREALLFTYLSPDGEEGYPGTVEIKVWYTAYEHPTDSDIMENVLSIEYEVELVGDECDETVVNVTNHSYFNLGHGVTIEGTEVTLSTVDYLATDSNGIPTGEIAAFPALEAERAFVLAAKEPLIDHCFVLSDGTADLSIDTRDRPMNRLLSAVCPSSRIHLEILSTEPAFQLYTGDFTDVPASEHGPARGARSGFCVEPGRFINAVNMPQWRSQVVLGRGQTYGSQTLYKVWRS